MRRFEVLLEGASDEPTVREVLVRRFGLVENEMFRLHPHRGRGKLPRDLLSQPDHRRQGLLDQLPAKLRGMSHLGNDGCVVVLIDVDQDRCDVLLADLRRMLERLPRRPANVLFRLAIEETESWFIADVDALAAAFPKASRQGLSRLSRLTPDAIVGAWEQLADALGVDRHSVTGATKYQWATRVAPHLDLDEPKSPSLRKFVDGIARQLPIAGSSNS